MEPNKRKKRKKQVNSMMKNLVSFDGPPLDFSYKKIKDLKELRTIEPRSGKRLPINTQKEEKKLKNEMTIEQKLKEAEEKTSQSELEKLDDEDEEDNSQVQEEVETKKKEPNRANIVPPNNIQAIIQQHNVLMDSSSNNQGAQENNDRKEIKKKKIKLINCSLILGYNEIRSITGFQAIIPDVMFNALENLQWLDLQHNFLVEISDEICNFRNLKSLYLHCNFIYDTNEFAKLCKLDHLRSLTAHGNPTDRIDGFRLIIISLFPILKKLDTVLITRKERDNAKYIGQLLGLTKLPVYELEDRPKPPIPENDKNNNNELGTMKYND